MARATLGTIIPSTTSGTALAALLNARTTAENSGHAGIGRPSYAAAGMLYTEDSGIAPRLFLAIGASGPDLDLTSLFSDSPGTLRTTAEVRLTPGWLWADGSAIARVTYPGLFDAICPAFTGDVANASATVTAVSEDLTKLGLIGAKVEGLGVSSGVTVTAVTANTLTLSANGTGTFAATSLRVFPHGNGNGSTTFNVPNVKGRVIIPRQDMGGTDSGLITTGLAGFDGTRLGASGGAQSNVLTLAKLPGHTHPISASGTASASADPGHGHAAGALFGQGSAGGGNKVNFTQTNNAQSAGDHGINIIGSTAIGGAHSHVVTLTLSATSSNPVGAVAEPINNVQPSIVENVVVKT